MSENKKKNANIPNEDFATKPIPTAQKPAGVFAKKKEQNMPMNMAKFSHCLENVKECVKAIILFGGLGMLFLYWYKTGQIVASAAFPSIIVCTLLAGFGIGKSVGKYIKW